MVVLLVVLMFAAFIAADYMFNREKYRLPMPSALPVSRLALSMEEEAAEGGDANKAPLADIVPVPAGEVPSHFHPAHTWAIAEGANVVRIGVDAFAARLLPIPDKVETPKLNRWVSQGGRGFSLRSGDRKVALLSPVDGEVVEVNHQVVEDPSLLKREPYGRGWLLKLRSPDMAVSLRNLLGPDLAHRWMEDSMHRLQQLVAPTVLATAQDGGPLVDSVAGTFSDEDWKKMAAEFFRT